MSFNYSKLRGRIVEKYDNMKNFAEALGTDPTSLSRKMQGHVGLSQKEIVEWGKLLGIPQEEYGIFFLDQS